MPTADEDGLDELAGALRGYLDELDGYRAVCQRHAPAVGVEKSGPALRLRASFAGQRSMEAVRAQVERLPCWRRSPYWPTEGRGWEERRSHANRAALAAAAGSRTVRGVAWEGRGVIIDARVDHAALHLELTAPELPTPLPELPLRVVAQLLGCLERLTAGLEALPRPGGGGRSSTVWEYLRRATPDDFPVGKLFSAPRAGP